MSTQRKVNSFKFIAAAAFICATLCGAGVQAKFQDLVELQKIEACMNRRIDPCEDFNGFICGNWPKIHARDPYDNIEEFLQHSHSMKIMDLMRQHYPMEQRQVLHHQNFMDKATIYLHSCLNIQSVDLMKYLKQIKPGVGLEWPLLEELNVHKRHAQYTQNRDWSEFDAFALLGQLHSYGLTNLVMQQKTQRVNGRILTVLTIPEETKFDSEAACGILDDMNFTKHAAARQLEELRKTHSYWQAAFKDYREFGESENLFSYDDIKKSNPQLVKFLQQIIPQHLKEDDAMVAMPYWDYIEFLLTRQWQPYENQKFCNYLLMHFLIYLKEISASGCLITGQQRMHLAYDYLYYRHSYLSQAREINKDITGITKSIHKHFLSTIYENHLNMSHRLVQATKERLATMTINVGNLPEKVDEAMVEEFYRHLPAMNVSNFYANDLKMLKHRVLESLNCLPSMSCDQHLAKSAPVYLSKDNLVIIPFDAFNSPLYQPQNHPVLTTSSLGFSLAHEFTHAIGTAELRSSSMHKNLLEEVLEHGRAKEALQCLQRQESTFVADEHIADLMGARVAYRVYSREYNKQPYFTSVPWKQLFFFNLGQFFCAKKESYLEDGDLYGSRLNRIAMNSESFAEAFKCREGSRMNPSRKCRFY